MNAPHERGTDLPGDAVPADGRRGAGRRIAAGPAAGRRGRQPDALRADVRRVRAGPGGGPHGGAAGGAAVRMAPARGGHAAAVPSGPADDLCRPGRGSRAGWRVSWPGCPGSAGFRRCCCSPLPRCSCCTRCAVVMPRLRCACRAATRARGGVEPPRRPADPQHRPLTPKRRLRAGRGAWLPALRLSLRGAGRGGVDRQPGARRGGHGRVRPRHRAGADRRSASPAMPPGGTGNASSPRPRPSSCWATPPCWPRWLCEISD